MRDDDDEGNDECCPFFCFFFTLPACPPHQDLALAVISSRSNERTNAVLSDVTLLLRLCDCPYGLGFLRRAERVALDGSVSAGALG